MPHNVCLVLNNTNLDWVQIYENIFELPQEEEAGGHALSARNSVWKDKECFTHMLARCFFERVILIKFLFSVPHSLAEPPTNWKNCCAIFKWSLWKDRYKRGNTHLSDAQLLHLSSCNSSSLTEILTDPISCPKAAFTTPFKIYSWENNKMIRGNPLICSFFSQTPSTSISTSIKWIKENQKLNTPSVSGDIRCFQRYKKLVRRKKNLFRNLK